MLKMTFVKFRSGWSLGLLLTFVQGGGDLLHMSSERAVENFRNYLRIKTVHPNPDYVGCLKFLTGMAKDIGLEHEIIEVIF